MKIKSILSISLLLLLSNCGNEQFSSEYTTTPPELDGSLNEWETVEKHATTDSSVIVQITNDDQYLYLAIRISDRPLQLMLQRFGFTTWYSPGGGRSKQYEMRFPASAAADFDQSRGGFWYAYSAQQRRDARSSLAEYRDGIFLMNTNSRSWHVYPENQDAAFASAMMSSAQGLIFEIRMPLNYSDEFVSIHHSGEEQITGLGVRLPQFAQRRSQGMGGGQPMQSGGQQRTGGPGMLQMTELWWEVQLASN